MFTEAKKSSSAEVAHRLTTTLIASCYDSDFIYEIESLRQSIDASSLPMKQTIEFVVTMRSAEDDQSFMTFYSQIKDLEVRLDFFSIPNYYVSLIDANVSDVELKERMLKAFESYSSFDLEFSIE